MNSSEIEIYDITAVPLIPYSPGPVLWGLIALVLLLAGILILKKSRAKKKPVLKSDPALDELSKDLRRFMGNTRNDYLSKEDASFICLRLKRFLSSRFKLESLTRLRSKSFAELENSQREAISFLLEKIEVLETSTYAPKSTTSLKAELAAECLKISKQLKTANEF